MKLVIDRQKWLRGEGKWESALLRKKDNKMCCLGFLGLEVGCDSEELLNRVSPEAVRMAGVHKYPKWLFDGGQHSKDAYVLMRANDDASIPDVQREETIAKTFAQHDIEVEFIN